MNISLWGVWCVWQRYFDVFKRNLAYGLFTTFLEPFLFLASFGFGLGVLIPDLHLEGVTLTYRQFVLAGIVGQAVLFQSFFEAAYGGFVRMYYQKIFQAMAVTPITLKEVIVGELLWDASKATFSASAVLIVGIVLGDFTLWGGLVVGLPLIFLSSLLFAALGFLAAAKSASIDAISYPQYIVVFPMFLFCGVFFPLTNLPIVFQYLAWAFPLTSFLSLFRSATLDLPWNFFAPLQLLGWFLLLLPWSYKAMQRRLVH
jgi:lipooligosaccharide transport system permease protein